MTVYPTSREDNSSMTIIVVMSATPESPRRLVSGVISRYPAHQKNTDQQRSGCARPRASSASGAEILL